MINEEYYEARDAANVYPGKNSFTDKELALYNMFDDNHPNNVLKTEKEDISKIYLQCELLSAIIQKLGEDYELAISGDSFTIRYKGNEKSYFRKDYFHLSDFEFNKYFIRDIKLFMFKTEFTEILK